MTGSMVYANILSVAVRTTIAAYRTNAAHAHAIIIIKWVFATTSRAVVDRITFICVVPCGCFAVYIMRLNRSSWIA